MKKVLAGIGRRKSLPQDRTPVRVASRNPRKFSADNPYDELQKDWAYQNADPRRVFTRTQLRGMLQVCDETETQRNNGSEDFGEQSLDEIAILGHTMSEREIHELWDAVDKVGPVTSYSTDPTVIPYCESQGLKVVDESHFNNEEFSENPLDRAATILIQEGEGDCSGVNPYDL